MAAAGKYNRVMLVDDNPMDNLVHSKLMETNSFAGEINACETAMESLGYLKTTDHSELPDLIFLDIIMPVMDGFQFLEEFEKLGAEITGKCKIILLSTSDSFKDLNRANKSKLVKKFLNKPLTAEKLAAINL